MSSSVLEIVELANGEFVLQRASGEGDPLVNIRFSEESKEYISEAGLEVARVMIQAGIQAVAYINEERTQTQVAEKSNKKPAKQVLH